jgi:hypothetical protein
MICVALQRIENIFVAALEGPVAVVERLMDSATTHGGSPYVDGINCVCVCGGAWRVKKKKRKKKSPNLWLLSSSFIDVPTFSAMGWDGVQ